MLRPARPWTVGTPSIARWWTSTASISRKQPDQRQAFVLIANPKDPAAKPVIFIAQFQRLIRPDGSQEWFLTSLVSHSAGLTRRQGWDNLLVQVQNQTP